MLDTLLDVYLADLANERAFDAPFLALLPALGFYDVHYTHGTGEFGKDFIAKKRENRRVVQYSFQLKRDVSQSEGRELAAQLFEAVQFPQTHPNFDTKKPHQPVLVVTGRLAPNAGVSLASLNTHANKFNARPFEVWGRGRLVGDLANVGLAGVHRATAQGIQSYGQFYSLVGEAIEGRLSSRTIERYSRIWLDVPDALPLTIVQVSTNGHRRTVETPDSTPSKNTKEEDKQEDDVDILSTVIGREMPLDRRLLIAAVEATLLAQRCQAAGSFYEAILCFLALWRAILHAWTRAQDQGEDELSTSCRALHERVRSLVVEAVDAYLTRIEDVRRTANGELVACLPTATGTSGALILTYPVECARWIEMAGLRFFLSGKKQQRAQLIRRLVDFVSHEPGCAHPVSERFAVSLVWPVLALAQSGERTLATGLVRKAAIWLADRHQHGAGLARLEATVEEEALLLLGSQFSFSNVSRSPSSLLATALADLSAWLADAPLYEDIVNDWRSLDVCPTFFAPPDSEGAFRFEAPDVVRHPNVTYSSTFSSFALKTFGSHISRQPGRYKLSDEVGLGAFVAVSLLLRDRYFPILWP